MQNPQKLASKLNNDIPVMSKLRLDYGRIIFDKANLKFPIKIGKYSSIENKIENENEYLMTKDAFFNDPYDAPSQIKILLLLIPY